MPEIIPNWNPILIHFTFALLFISPFFFVTASLGKKHEWSKDFLIAGRACLWTGILITVLTLLAGFGAMKQAHEYISEATHHHIHDHRNWAIVTASSFALLSLWSFVNWRRGMRESGLLVPLLLPLPNHWQRPATSGELVYQHGVGVLPPLASGSHEGHMPNSESSSTDHHDPSQ